MIKVVELKPIKETPNDFEELEKRIRKAFIKFLYAPIIKALGVDSDKLLNARISYTLGRALRTGRVSYDNGKFTGKFNADISKELKTLAQSGIKKKKSSVLPKSRLPDNYRKLILEAQEENEKRIAEIDKHLAKLLPEEISTAVKSHDIFDKTLWKTDKEVAKTLQAIQIAPNLSTESRKKIAAEWQTNMDLWIKGFAEEEIPRLRREVQTHVFEGKRYGDLVKVIQKSYDVTERKAKFLARQETNLLMTKFKETRYVKAGVEEYKWCTVVGTPTHPVRKDHKKLDGEIFRWDTPPITNTKTNARNNPGQDYNCRCFAKPIIKFGVSK